MLHFSRVYPLTLIGLLTLTLSGCAAVHTSIAKRNLDVQTRISSAIFVEAVPPSKRSLYVDIRSGVMEFDRNAFKAAVLAEFGASGNGYRIVDDPEQAQYLMNVFVTKLEKASPTAAEAELSRGYRGDVGAGVALGVSVSNRRGGNVVGGAIIGAMGATAVNALVQDVTFLLVADVQIKERARDGVIVRKDTKISTREGDSGTSTQRVSEATDLKEYRTRIVTTANKANLELEEAQPLMFQKTAYAMSSFF